MGALYGWIVQHPGKFVIVFLAAFIAISAAPASWLVRLTPWEQSSEWARLVFQLGTLVVVLVGGVIPIARWYADQINKIKDDKPIVIADLIGGTYQIRNIGNSPAVNVWLMLAEHEGPVALGSLDAHQERPMPESANALIKKAKNAGHILIAASRPATARPYTVTLNAHYAQDAAVRHGFLERLTDKQLRRSGTIGEYLQHERTQLLQQLQEFAL
jgi:hypothetical protein